MWRQKLFPTSNPVRSAPRQQPTSKLNIDSPSAWDISNYWGRSVPLRRENREGLGSTTPCGRPMWWIFLLAKAKAKAPCPSKFSSNGTLWPTNPSPCFPDPANSLLSFPFLYSSKETRNYRKEKPRSTFLVWWPPQRP